MKRLKLILSMLFSIPFTVAFVGALLFLPTGNYFWTNGWMLIGSLLFYILLIFIYFIIKDPETLENRSKLSTEKGDTLYLGALAIVFLAVMGLPVLGYRLGWYRFPLWISWIGFSGLILSYLIIFLVLRENSFASKGLRIHEGQTVIQTGPYSIVRHPMYVSAIIMGLSLPVTLGSPTGLIPALLIPLIFALRIGKEEAMLLRELEGYDQYRNKVKFRLIPGVW